MPRASPQPSPRCPQPSPRCPRPSRQEALLQSWTWRAFATTLKITVTWALCLTPFTSCHVDRVQEKRMTQGRFRSKDPPQPPTPGSFFSPPQALLCPSLPWLLGSAPCGLHTTRHPVFHPEPGCHLLRHKTMLTSFFPAENP